MIKDAIIKLSKRENLFSSEAEAAMNEIMLGVASPVQMASYLTALSMKGETVLEITASAKIMRQHCIKLLHEMEVLEIVGTGGDSSNSFNISTAAAIVASACGAKVAKHGNRSVSSMCGSADVLEELGINIDVTAQKSSQLLKKIGICFLYAQNYHIAMKFVAPVRKELGIKTIFNILGPLTNPAGATMQLLGVYDKELVLPLATVLKDLGVKRALVVCGEDGLDEISLCADSFACLLLDGKLKEFIINPEKFGLKKCSKDDLIGGNAAQNAKLIIDILSNKGGPKADAVLLNAGAALFIANFAESIDAGIALAREAIETGRAKEKLRLWREFS